MFMFNFPKVETSCFSPASELINLIQHSCPVYLMASCLDTDLLLGLVPESAFGTHSTTGTTVNNNLQVILSQ